MKRLYYKTKSSLRYWYRTCSLYKEFGGRVFTDSEYRKKVARRVYERKRGRRVRKIRGSGFLSNRPKIKTRLFRERGNKCQWCFERMKYNEATIDHIKPVRDGGGNELENLQLLHSECHELKNRLGATGREDLIKSLSIRVK